MFKDVNITEIIIGAVLGTALSSTVFYLTRKKFDQGVESYIERLLNTWVIGSGTTRVPIRKLAILSIELARYKHGKVHPEMIMDSTRQLRGLAEKADYKLTKKQWSKVRIAARKILKGKDTQSPLGVS